MGQNKCEARENEVLRSARFELVRDARSTPMSNHTFHSQVHSYRCMNVFIRPHIPSNIAVHYFHIPLYILSSTLKNAHAPILTFISPYVSINILYRRYSHHLIYIPISLYLRSYSLVHKFISPHIYIHIPRTYIHITHFFVCLVQTRQQHSAEGSQTLQGSLS